MKYVLVFILVAIVSFGLFLSNYLGAFKGVDISQGPQGPLQLVYIDYMGPYHKISKEIEKVENFFKAQGTPCGRSFGEYLDDPQSVEEARLRAKAGCVVEQVPANLPEGFKTETLPSKNYVIATFTGSPGIGPLKVYPKVNKFMLEKGLKQSGPVLEIYEIHSITEKNAMTTTYLFPVQ
ncbi:GyrI-like domain-containing protein [Bdellovibrio sp. HCB2-146]|uniref:GyrI-like domain-containing protein n=1 Tax=Bdellovibrio sp. HCB2-146 TaxID=3394362 RepID=UPI0039BD2933